MSLKAELEMWVVALKAFEEGDFEEALNVFSTIAESSRTLTNIGLIHAALGNHEAAVKQLTAATVLDPYLAIAYFQCGVSNFLLDRYEHALKNFGEALLYLREHQSINYQQLGLRFNLFHAEVLFNKGLTLIYMGKSQDGLADLEEALKWKSTDEHSVIDDAIMARGQGYTMFSIPAGVLFSPSERKLRSTKKTDFMGQAKLVYSTDTNDRSTMFKGFIGLMPVMPPSDASVAPPDKEINLQPGLSRDMAASSPGNEYTDVPPLRAKTTLRVFSGLDIFHKPLFHSHPSTIHESCVYYAPDQGLHHQHHSPFRVFRTRLTHTL